MNIYNLQDFKCGFCTKWFHPHNSVPYSLPCSHAICATCLKSLQKKSKTSINCIHHNTPQSLANLKINRHIQQALQRLLKNQSPQSVPVKKMYERKNELESLLNEKKQDLRAFTELLEQIYNNQINRILSLKKRVLREVTDSSVSFTQWSKNIQCKDQYEIEQEGKVVEEKIRQFCQLNIEEMAQIIIADPAICLQRQFSIYNLIKKQERKTLKSSVQHNDRFPNRSLLSSFVQPNGKQNIYLNIKTVNSPIERSNDSEHCKQLSSFKLEDSRSIHQYSRLDLQSNALKRLSYKQSEFCQQNGDTTLRDTQQFQSKVVIKQREKRMSDKLQDLISSLKPNKDHEQLIYSPDNQSFEEELLLSNTKHDVNFLRQHQFEHKPSQKSMQIRQRPVISSERQKNKYVKRMETVRTQQAYYNTNIIGNTIELFNCDLKEVNLKVLLDKFDWKEIQVIKLIGTGLQDKQLNQLLNYMIDSRVHSLLLSNNELQEISLDAILRFTEINKYLKTVSLQKNNIHQLHTNAKAKLALLKQRGVVLYI